MTDGDNDVFHDGLQLFSVQNAVMRLQVKLALFGWMTKSDI